VDMDRTMWELTFGHQLCRQFRSHDLDVATYRSTDAVVESAVSAGQRGFWKVCPPIPRMRPSDLDGCDAPSFEQRISPCFWAVSSNSTT
jgi:hypothetical protein